MHITAIENCQQFFDVYAHAFPSTAKVIEIGSQDVNGSLRSCCPERFAYTGVDFVSGKGVDIVLDDPYSLPFDDGSIDIVLTSSCFEHAEMFWLLFLDAMRILKPHGLLYLNVPSNGEFHRFPVDCWRFYPDSGRALVNWSKRNGLKVALLESYTSEQRGDVWNDYVAIFLKDENEVYRFPDRVLAGRDDLSNGVLYGAEGFFNYRFTPEDRRKLTHIGSIIGNKAEARVQGDTYMGLFSFVKKILFNGSRQASDKEKLSFIERIINNDIKIR